MRKLLGFSTILLILLITLTLWLQSKEDLSVIIDNPIKSLNQIFALLGVVLISIEAFLATRARILEKMFGGLDEVYHAHKNTGSIGFALILQHPVMLILNAFPNTQLALNYLIPNFNNWPYFFGIVGLFILSILLIFTLFVKMPYHIWKKSHALMGIPVILTFVHVLLINSDTSVYLPLKIWILSIIVISILSALYRKFLYSSLAPHFHYVVSFVGISIKKDVLKIVLSPSNPSKAIEHKPGDFVYIKFLNKLIGKEKHPFSISSTPGSNELRLIVKINGDFTKKLTNLKLNDKTILWGPYGGFADAYQHNKQDQVWIAGGIGVTPFLSLLPCEVQQQSQKISRISRNVTLYYCVNTLSEAIFKDEIHKQCEEVDGLDFKLIASNTDGRLNATRISSDIGNKIFTTKFFLCGPPIMMEDITRQLQALGVKNKQIFYENFSFV